MLVKLIQSQALSGLAHSELHLSVITPRTLYSEQACCVLTVVGGGANRPSSTATRDTTTNTRADGSKNAASSTARPASKWAPHHDGAAIGGRSSALWPGGRMPSVAPPP
ncbi:hypothetical protein GCM10027590_32160 [Nocardiopsis nanhaiensis]